MMLPEEKRIYTKTDLKRFIAADMKGYRKSSRGRTLFCFQETDILIKHSILLRKSEYHKNNAHKFREIFFRIRLNRLQNKYSLHIPLNCCDEGLKIMHVGPVLMNGNVSVGKNCAMHINTGLVAGGLNSDLPTLGDGVVVGFGAVVLGGIKIANNVAIGANAVVNKDVTEENVAVAGAPAQIISHNGRLNWNKK